MEEGIRSSATVLNQCINYEIDQEANDLRKLIGFLFNVAMLNMLQSQHRAKSSELQKSLSLIIKEQGIDPNSIYFDLGLPVEYMRKNYY